MDPRAPRWFVGRAAALDRLDGAYRRAVAGEPAGVLVCGDAGIGKSTLVARFVGSSGAGQVLTGACVRLADDNSSFVPFVGLLRAAVRRRGVDGIDALVGRTARAHLAHLLPDLGDPPPPDEGTRSRIFAAVLALLERLAEDEPVVVVLEDLHWADPSSWDLYAFLVRNLVDARVLVVGTHRALPATHPLREPVTELLRSPGVTRIELAPLTVADTRELVATVQGRPDHAFADRLHARSEGNPLFLEALLESGGDGAVPARLRDLLVVPVESLPEASRQVAFAVAVGGHHVEHGLLVAVTGLPAAELEAALRPALDAAVLTATVDGYGFRHVLIGDAVYDELLLPGERIRLHARFAEAIAADPVLAPPALCYAPGEMARHWTAARDVPRAFAALWRAAEEGRELLAHRERLDMLRRLIALWPRIDDPVAVTGASFPEVLRLAVEAADESGDLDEAMALSDRALDVARNSGDSQVQAMVLERRARIRRRLGIGGAKEDLEAALALVPVEPPSGLRARLLGYLARRAYVESDRTEAMRLAGEAHEMAERVGDRYAAALATLIRAGVQTEAGDVVGGEDAYRCVRNEARRIRVPMLAIRSYSEQADALTRSGRPGDGARVARDGLPLAAEMGQARTLGVRLAATLAEALWSLGRWDEALEVLENAAEQQPPRGYLAALWALRGRIHCARGDVDTAGELVDAVNRLLENRYDTVDEHYPQARLAAAVRIAQGRDEEALEIALDAFAAHEPTGEPYFAWPLLVLAATAAQAVGLRSGREAGACLAEIAARLPAPTADARAERATYARLTAGTGSRTEAREAELAAWEEAARPFGLAWALVGAAEAALARRDRATAAERLRRATELGTALGTVPLLDEVAATAKRARLTLEPGPESEPLAEAEPLATRLGLTGRELEVLELVASGMTNRQIGERLFISTKTASVHVSRILTKLDVTTRGEAAATAHRLRLVGADR
ncbi:ATP-binding protein [Pseudonocardia zijingensis]|uniref:ATP-binding protein n=1 Tax=Pseudonocardia zijingensis TaxID=153376 RepID=UPI00360EAA90